MSHFSTVVAVACVWPKNPGIGQSRINTKYDVRGVGFRAWACLFLGA